MQARDIMTSPAITVTPDTHIPELARIMRANQISGIPVVDDDGKLLGIVTDHDLILRNAPVREPRYFSVLSGMIPLHMDEYKHYKEQLRHTMAVTAADLIEPGIHTLSPETLLEEAMQTMLDPKVTLLPVVEDDRVVGVVTRTDLVRLIERLEGALDPEAQEAALEEKVLAGVIAVILHVQDMGAMVDFYCNQLGLEVLSPDESDDLAQESWVVLETGACNLALHAGGQRRLGEDAPRIVFGVADIEQVRTVLVERGVALEPVFETALGTKVCDGRDPEGNPFALEEQLR